MDGIDDKSKREIVRVYLFALALLLLAIAVLVMMTPRQAEAWGHAAAAPVAPILKALGIKGGAVAGGTAGGAAAAGFVAGTGVAVLVCGLNQPKRNYRRDTYVDHHSDIVESGTQYRPRKDGCMTKKKRQNRAPDPAKLWPNGK